MLSVKTPRSCTPFPALEKPRPQPQWCLSFPAPTINSQGSSLVGGSPGSITCPEKAPAQGLFFSSHLSLFAEWEEWKKTLAGD